MTSKRSTWYRADRDDETGDVIIHRKRVVHQPDGYFAEEDEARDDLTRRERQQAAIARSPVQPADKDGNTVVEEPRKPIEHRGGHEPVHVVTSPVSAVVEEPKQAEQAEDSNGFSVDYLNIKVMEERLNWTEVEIYERDELIYTASVGHGGGFIQFKRVGRKRMSTHHRRAISKRLHTWSKTHKPRK